MEELPEDARSPDVSLFFTTSAPAWKQGRLRGREVIRASRFGSASSSSSSYPLGAAREREVIRASRSAKRDLRSPCFPDLRCLDFFSTRSLDPSRGPNQGLLASRFALREARSANNFALLRRRPGSAKREARISSRFRPPSRGATRRGRAKGDGSVGGPQGMQRMRAEVDVGEEGGRGEGRREGVAPRVCVVFVRRPVS